MKHPSSRIVLDYWNERRRGRPAPERTDIDPGAIRHALPDTFMLAADFVGDLRFRLAGTRVCALFGREVKGESFRSFWAEESRQQIDSLLGTVTDENIGAVAGLAGTSADGIEINIEMLLLPLAHSGQTRIRAFGVLAPMAPPFWLGEKAVIELTVRTLRHIDGERDDVPASAATRRRRGFTVYPGGRAAPETERTG
jgi:hypothetical protein